MPLPHRHLQNRGQCPKVASHEMCSSQLRLVRQGPQQSAFDRGAASNSRLLRLAPQLRLLIFARGQSAHGLCRNSIRYCLAAPAALWSIGNENTIHKTSCRLSAILVNPNQQSSPGWVLLEMRKRLSLKKIRKPLSPRQSVDGRQDFGQRLSVKIPAHRQYLPAFHHHFY